MLVEMAHHNLSTHSDKLVPICHLRELTVTMLDLEALRTTSFSERSISTAP